MPSVIFTEKYVGTILGDWRHYRADEQVELTQEEVDFLNVDAPGVIVPTKAVVEPPKNKAVTASPKAKRSRKRGDN